MVQLHRPLPPIVSSNPNGSYSSDLQGVAGPSTSRGEGGLSDAFKEKGSSVGGVGGEPNITFPEGLVDDGDSQDEFDGEEDSQDELGGEEGAQGDTPKTPGSQAGDLGESPSDPAILDRFSVQFKRVFDTVVGFFPEATTQAPQPESQLAATEEIFANHAPFETENKRFHRFSKFEQVRESVANMATSPSIVKQKDFRDLLKHAKGSYQLWGPEPEAPSQFNTELSRLRQSFSGDSLSTSFSTKDMDALEDLISTQESQSFSMWLLAGLLRSIKQGGPGGGTPSSWRSSVPPSPAPRSGQMLSCSGLRPTW